MLWQASAWALFHTLMAEEPRIATQAEAAGVSPDRVARFVFDQADWIIGHQHTAETTSIPEYVGGFPRNRVPHSVTSCYVEAVIRALGLADRLGEASRIASYRASARAGLRFLTRLQIDPKERHILARPSQAIGGISGTLTSFQLRNDRDQHAITCFVAGLETPALFDG